MVVHSLQPIMPNIVTCMKNGAASGYTMFHMFCCFYVFLWQLIVCLTLLKVVSFSRVAKVGDVVSILRSNKHNGFSVCITFIWIPPFTIVPGFFFLFFFFGVVVCNFTIHR